MTNAFGLHYKPAIHLFERFYITERDQVIDVWNIDLRGCVQ